MVINKVDKFTWHRVFVLFPKDTVDNELVFMQKVYRRWNVELGGFCDSSGYSGSDGGWEYKL